MNQDEDPGNASHFETLPPIDWDALRATGWTPKYYTDSMGWRRVYIPEELCTMYDPWHVEYSKPRLSVRARFKKWWRRMW